MNTRIVPRAAGRLGVIAAVLCGLAGCVAYVPAQPASYSYYDNKGNLVSVPAQTVPQSPAPVYVAPAPAYVAPAYVGPPIYLGFGFGFYNSWGGHRGGWHRHRW